MSLPLLLLLSELILSWQLTQPIRQFVVVDASNQYDVHISITGCEEDGCEGKASLRFFKKGSSVSFQTLQIKNLILELDSTGAAMSNWVQAYGLYNSGLVFEDFNFDGVQDLALRTGNNGAYDGPSYDVFLYSQTKKKFIRNPRLTRLASENLGLFGADSLAKTITTFTKSGCCWHEITKYRMVGDKPHKIYVWSEDVMTDTVIVTVDSLTSNGTWMRSSRSVPLKGYQEN